ncbi:DNRLRE domain-containing protein [Nocardiopsis eucommiae]|uniref:DNRLRE domain-containing protein n=1 Tax=Nocardiopsis eucommiae TaxID=2831970 RepID=A0A975L909_9ACTN|nr:DNRLRE domain-containing protein [Nocardiopsis eucommiae]
MAENGSLGTGRLAWDRVYTRRALFRFPVELGSESVVESAVLRVDVAWSYDCESDSVVELHRVDPFDENTTWNDQPASRGLLDTRNVRGGHTACPLHGGVEFDVTEAYQRALDDGEHHLHLRLGAADESGSTAWRRFDVEDHPRPWWSTTAPRRPGTSRPQRGPPRGTASSRRTTTLRTPSRPRGPCDDGNRRRPPPGPRRPVQQRSGPVPSGGADGPRDRLGRPPVGRRDDPGPGTPIRRTPQGPNPRWGYRGNRSMKDDTPLLRCFVRSGGGTRRRPVGEHRGGRLPGGPGVRTVHAPVTRRSGRARRTVRLLAGRRGGRPTNRTCPRRNQVG